MSGLTFFEEGHRYELDGVEIPSVSHILRFMRQEIYGEAPKWMVENAARRGTRVHEITATLDADGTAECDEELLLYVDAYVRFLKDIKPSWTAIEKPYHNAEMGFAGTIDRAGVIDGKRVIVDIKVQEQIKKPLVQAQLNAYGILYGDVDQLLCLQLKKDGTYKLHPVTEDPGIFLACYTIHKTLEKKRRKKRE